MPSILPRPQSWSNFKMKLQEFGSVPEMTTYLKLCISELAVHKELNQLEPTNARWWWPEGHGSADKDCPQGRIVYAPHDSNFHAYTVIVNQGLRDDPFYSHFTLSKEEFNSLQTSGKLIPLETLDELVDKITEEISILKQFKTNKLLIPYAAYPKSIRDPLDLKIRAVSQGTARLLKAKDVYHDRLTQEDLADICGVTVRTIRNWIKTLKANDGHDKK